MSNLRSARHSLTLAVVIAVIIGGSAGTQHAAPAAPAVAIELVVKSFTANVSGAVPLGTEILVTLLGSPGGRASFSIPNVVDRVPMTEASGGVYIGRYTVVTGHDVNGAAIVGQLIAKDGTSSPMLAAPQHISIDTTCPKLVNVFPADGERVATPRPVLFCGYNDGAGTGIDPRSVTVQVDGYDVTAASAIGKFGVSYQPAADLAIGQHTFYVSVADAAGNPARAIQRFQIVAPGPDTIQSLTTDAPSKLVAGEPLTVILTAAAGGDAELSVPPFPGTIRLTEVRPGRYQGKFIPKAGGSVAAAPVIVRLTRGDGNCSISLDHPLTVSAGAPASPKITLPGEDDEFQGAIEMAGRAPADAIVVCALSYDSRSEGGIMPFSGNALNVVMRADGKGRWHAGPCTLHLKSLYEGNSDTRMKLSAVTVDADGNESLPDAVPVAYAP